MAMRTEPICTSCGSTLQRQEATVTCVVDEFGIMHRWVTDEAQAMSRYLRCANVKCGLSLTKEDLIGE